MDFSEVLRRRRMTRRFATTPLADEVLDTILRAGTRAPSAGFAQGVDLLVLTEQSDRERFWELATDTEWRASDADSTALCAAPAIVLPVADPLAYGERYGEPDKDHTLLAGRDPESWPTPFWLVDTAFAAMLILLAATSSGVGALFFQLHSPEHAVLEGFDIPLSHRLIGAIALGYPGVEESIGSPASRKRRGFDSVVHKGAW